MLTDLLEITQGRLSWDLHLGICFWYQCSYPLPLETQRKEKQVWLMNRIKTH